MSPIERKGEPSQRRAYLTGVTLLLLASLLWSLNGAFIKVITAGGLGPGGVCISFYRSLFAGLLLWPLARGKFHTLRATTSASGSPSAWLWRVSGCVVFFTMMTSCFVVANTKTAAANAIILQYTSTFWVFALSPLLLKEKTGTRDRWILLQAMAGIAIIFAGNATTDLTGLLIALAAGLFYGLLTLMLRLVRHTDAAAVTVVNNLGAALLLLPIVVLTDDLVVLWRTLILLVLMGVVQLGLPYYFFSLGLGRVPAQQASLLTMLEPLLVPIWAYLSVGEKAPLSTVVGGGVILSALLLLLLGPWRGARSAN